MALIWEFNLKMVLPMIDFLTSLASTGGIIFELCLGQAVHSCFPGLGPVHIGWWGRGGMQHTAREAGDLAFLQGLFTPVEFN